MHLNVFMPRTPPLPYSGTPELKASTSLEIDANRAQHDARVAPFQNDSLCAHSLDERKTKTRSQELVARANGLHRRSMSESKLSGHELAASVTTSVDDGSTMCLGMPLLRPKEPGTGDSGPSSQGIGDSRPSSAPGLSSLGIGDSRPLSAPGMVTSLSSRPASSASLLARRSKLQQSALAENHSGFISTQLKVASSATQYGPLLFEKHSATPDDSSQYDSRLRKMKMVASSPNTLCQTVVPKFQGWTATMKQQGPKFQRGGVPFWGRTLEPTAQETQLRFRHERRCHWAFGHGTSYSLA